ncbi:MAG: glycoside hydrolase family 30 beta sandwich domain-containing protein [Terracidiphilus sp.]|nr:glycoside hydrolase family 30 beta sandwich domain-containing protein [Terracidiphilus sp.]MDR3776354.1 glycoside hydrolase family 30 beta sandwich domain-containing protein [Terracidiphilus sp.]
MLRFPLFAACLGLVAFAAAAARAQSVSVFQTTPDLVEALSPRQTLHFSAKPSLAPTAPLITVDDAQRFQEIDGFGASLTDAAAWLFAKKLTPAQTDAAFKTLFSRKDGIALGFLRQPIGSSDLAVTFYSYDDLCEQTAKACTTPAGAADPKLEHYSLKHDQEYILPLLKKALAVNPGIHVMLTPWSPPGWMKTSGTMLGSSADGKQPSSLRPEFYPAFASYLVKTVEGYQAAGVPVYALSVENEPLYTPPTYSGMQMLATEQAAFFGNDLGPALAAAHLSPKVMAYDHNWDRPDYPETVLKDPKAAAVAAGTAWHHYAGDPAVMTKNHEEFPNKDQWVTESSGGTWQKGNVLAEEAAELIAVTRNWAKSYVLWALATDQKHGPVVGGCDTCRGLVTIDLSDPEKATVKPELDYYVLGHASKFVLPGAVRIASDEPAGAQLKDVAFRNPNGTVVLYALNAGTASQELRIGFHGKTATTTLPAGAVATFVWKP